MVGHRSRALPHHPQNTLNRRRVRAAGRVHLQLCPLLHQRRHGQPLGVLLVHLLAAAVQRRQEAPQVRRRRLRAHAVRLQHAVHQRHVPRLHVDHAQKLLNKLTVARVRAALVPAAASPHVHNQLLRPLLLLQRPLLHHHAQPRLEAVHHHRPRLCEVCHRRACAPHAGPANGGEGDALVCNVHELFNGGGGLCGGSHIDALPAGGESPAQTPAGPAPHNLRHVAERLVPGQHRRQRVQQRADHAVAQALRRQAVLHDVHGAEVVAAPRLLETRQRRRGHHAVVEGHDAQRLPGAGRGCGGGGVGAAVDVAEAVGEEGAYSSS
eukprot:Rhum_TRINITY_DN11914_c0_g2::Rhum_TRINITY_DN11914_c0_g2_i1::g.47885::m.47885